MTRRLITIAVYLALGAATTIAVSWGFALFGTFNDGKLHASYEKPLEEQPPVPTPPDWSLRSWHWFRGIGIRRDLISECEWMGSRLGMRLDGRPQRTLIAVRAGWPMHAMEWYDYHAELPRQGANWLEVSWWSGVDVGLKSSRGTSSAGRWDVEPRLPLRPLWMGFAINTLLYSAASWAAIAGFHAWRRFRRRRRGLCEACAYPLAGAGVCPECGSARQPHVLPFRPSIVGTEARP